MNQKWIAGGAVVFLSLLPVGGAAGPNSGAKVLLHVLGAGVGELPEAAPELGDYREAVVEIGAPGTYDIAVYVGGISAEYGMAGVEMGLAFDEAGDGGADLIDGRWLGDFTVPFGDWPAEGGWVTTTWSSEPSCPNRPFMAVGILRVRVTGPDRLFVVPSPRRQGVAIGSCLRECCPMVLEDDLPPESLGWIGFLGVEGKNPGSDPFAAIDPLTWGAVKAINR